MVRRGAGRVEGSDRSSLLPALPARETGSMSPISPEAAASSLTRFEAKLEPGEEGKEDPGN